MAQALCISDFEIIFAVLLLGLQVDIACCQGRTPFNITKTRDPLQGYSNAVQTIGELHGDWIEGNTTSLLEICELGDLLPV